MVSVTLSTEDKEFVIGVSVRHYINSRLPEYDLFGDIFDEVKQRVAFPNKTALRSWVRKEIILSEHIPNESNKPKIEELFNKLRFSSEGFSPKPMPLLFKEITRIINEDNTKRYVQYLYVRKVCRELEKKRQASISQGQNKKIRDADENELSAQLKSLLLDCYYNQESWDDPAHYIKTFETRCGLRFDPEFLFSVVLESLDEYKPTPLTLNRFRVDKSLHSQLKINLADYISRGLARGEIRGKIKALIEANGYSLSEELMNTILLDFDF